MISRIHQAPFLVKGHTCTWACTHVLSEGAIERELEMSLTRGMGMPSGPVLTFSGEQRRFSGQDKQGSKVIKEEPRG